MTTEERMTISRPEDILGFIPHALGYSPKESLVAMTMHGKSLGATLRVDLPADGSAHTLARYAQKIREYLEADDGADGVLLAFFTDEGWEQDDARPRLPLLDVLELALSRCGLEVRDAWIVGAGFWRNAYCTDDSCCPWPGRPASEILDSRLNAEMVYRGSSVREAPGATLGPTHRGDVQDHAVMAAEERHLAQLLPKWNCSDCFDMVLAVWQRFLVPASEGGTRSNEALSDDVRGFLRATLRIPSWRDAVVVLAAAGAGAARSGADAFGLLRPDHDGESTPTPEPPQGLPPHTLSPNTTSPHTTKTAQGLNASGAPDPTDGKGAAGYGEVLLGLVPAIPDWAAMNSLDHVLKQLGEGCGGEGTAAALTVRGWIEWCRGRGSFADALYCEAQAEHPGYRLAVLLGEVLHRGTICGWAKRRDAAWRRFGGTAA